MRTGENFNGPVTETPLKQINQLVGYLNGAENLNSFKYVFNAEKLSMEEARSKMTTFINANKQAVFDGIKNNASLRDELFSEIDLDELNVNDLTPEKIAQIINQVVEVY